jgi:hypothetical protein
MEDHRITPATLAAARRLNMTPETLADILDVYTEEAARDTRERRARTLRKITQDGQA